MSFKQTGTFQVAQGESETTNLYHANHSITTKFLGKKHHAIKPKTKGEAFFLKDTNSWYFQPKGSDDTYRVKEYHLDCNVEVGFYGYGIYNGLNASIKGKKGEIHLTKELDWVFVIPSESEEIEGATFRLNNPESVELI